MTHQIPELLQRITQYCSSFENTKDISSARKFAEAICRLILIGAGKTPDIVEKANGENLNVLIESISKKNISISENHLRKIIDDLRRIQTYGNIDAHDNDALISADEIFRLSTAIDSILQNVFDSKDIFDFDLQLPNEIYKKLNKFDFTEENWRCDHILSIVYPNREKVTQISDRGFNFFTLKDADSRLISVLFIGRNVSFKQVFEKTLTHQNIAGISSLTFIFPQEISKTTKTPVRNRKRNIQAIAANFLQSYPNVATSFDFTEDYIWDKCLPNSAKGVNLTASVEPYFIDQELHSPLFHSKVMSLDFIDSIVRNTREVEKPIYIIFGDGGVGKTTFCEQAIEKVTEHYKNGQKRKAILLSSYDLPEDFSNTSNKVQSIQDLYSLMSINNEDAIDLKSLTLNVSSGNLLLIIDGLDEIISRLKERFDIDGFIDSVIKLNDTYKNCSVIITSREIEKEKFLREDIALMYLRGFDRQLIEKYLQKRFHDLPAPLSNARTEIDLIHESSTITPLIIRLLCDLAYDEKNKSRQLPECKYLNKANLLDNTLIQLMDREIDKQSLDINCDEYFDILKDIVFEHRGEITKPNFVDLIEYTLSGRPRKAKQENFDNFFLSMLLKKHQDANGVDFFGIKYDALILIIKARYISYCINNCIGDTNSDVISMLTHECYRGGSLVREIGKYKSRESAFERQMLRKTINLLEQEIDISNQRKIISSMIYIYCEPEEKTKENVTTAIRRLFPLEQPHIYGLSIYGDFYPLDFTDMKVKNGLFSEYENLAKSKIPTDIMIFDKCTFTGISKSNFGKNTISAANFSKDCIICPDLQELIEINSDANERKNDYVKADLKRILKIGFHQGTFSWKSEQIYKQQAGTLKSKFSLATALQTLEQNGFLKKEGSTGSAGIGYFVTKEKASEVKDFLRQNIISNQINELIIELIEK